MNKHVKSAQGVEREHYSPCCPSWYVCLVYCKITQWKKNSDIVTGSKDVLNLSGFNQPLATKKTLSTLAVQGPQDTQTQLSFGSTQGESTSYERTLKEFIIQAETVKQQ